MKKTRRVRAWACLYSGEFLIDVSPDKISALNVARLWKGKVVPCTITYQVNEGKEKK